MFPPKLKTLLKKFSWTQESGKSICWCWTKKVKKACDRYKLWSRSVSYDLQIWNDQLVRNLRWYVWCTCDKIKIVQLNLPVSCSALLTGPLMRRQCKWVPWWLAPCSCPPFLSCPWSGLKWTGLLTNSILFCWLFPNQGDGWRKVCFQQTHNQNLRQLFLLV